MNKTKMFNVGWLATHGLLCAGLLLGADLSARASDWSTRAIGGTACDSQDKLLQKACQHAPGTKKPCTLSYKECNQNPGKLTRICQVQGAGGNACASLKCVSRANDTLSTECTTVRTYP